MCGVCGCRQLIPLAAEEPRLANSAPVALSPESDVRRLAVERSLLDHNRAHAESLAKRLAERGIEAIGILGGPGAGKTALLEATFEHLGREDAAREAVVEGDCATDFDARRATSMPSSCRVALASSPISSTRSTHDPALSHMRSSRAVSARSVRPSRSPAASRWLRVSRFARP